MLNCKDCTGLPKKVSMALKWKSQGQNKKHNQFSYLSRIYKCIYIITWKIFQMQLSVFPLCSLICSTCFYPQSIRKTLKDLEWEHMISDYQHLPKEAQHAACKTCHRGAQPCSLLHLFLLHTLLFITLCRGTCRGWDRDVYTSQPGPSAACKCLPECDTFFIGHGPLCNVVMFYADREERATGRQTAFMNLVKWISRWHCTEIINLPAIIHMLFYHCYVRRNVNWDKLFWISVFHW